MGIRNIKKITKNKPFDMSICIYYLYLEWSPIDMTNETKDQEN